MNLKSIRWKIILLIIVTLIPLTVLKIYEIHNRLNESMEHELNASEDLAAIISSTFTSYIEGVWRTQNTMGLAILLNTNWEEKHIKQYLEGVLSSNKRITAYAWLSPEGNVVAATEGKNQNLLASDHFQRIIKGEEKIVSNLMVRDDSGEMIIIIARGIKLNGELMGIISSELKVDNIHSIFHMERIGEGSSYGLVDLNGNIVYRNGIQKLSYEQRKISEHSPAWKALNNNVYRDTGFKSSIDGSMRLGVVYPIEALGWACFATTSKDQMSIFSKHNLLKELIFFLGILLISFLLALRLSNGLSKSFDKLVEISNEVAKGNLNVKANFKHDDPLVVIGQTFDNMTAALKERIQSIEEYKYQKSQFLATVSHELKTPLNIILGGIQLVERLSSERDLEEMVLLDKHLHILKQNSYRLLRLINNLVDISRTDVEKIGVNLKNNDLVSVAEEIILSVVDFAALKDIELIFDTEVEEKTIAFDHDMLERIILNLLSNAIKFTEAGGIIEVNIYDKHDKIQLSVKDTGVGIPPDKLENIFEPFMQVDNTLSRKAEGTGIGLSLVKHLVELHGGKIQVKSQLNVGSEFIVELPVRLIEGESIVTYTNEFTNVERIKIEFSDIYMNYRRAEV